MKKNTPSEQDEICDQRVTFRATKSLDLKIKQAAKADNRKVSDWVRLKLESLFPKTESDSQEKQSTPVLPRAHLKPLKAPKTSSRSSGAAGAGGK